MQIYINLELNHSPRSNKFLPRRQHSVESLRRGKDIMVPLVSLVWSLFSYKFQGVSLADLNLHHCTATSVTCLDSSATFYHIITGIQYKLYGS